MAAHIEQAELEDGEQPDRTGADDQRVGVDRIRPDDGFVRHEPRSASSGAPQPCRSGVVIFIPSRAALTVIWHDRREFGFTS